MLKKLLLLVLSILLLMSAAGCGRSSSRDNAGATTASNGRSTGAATVDSGMVGNMYKTGLPIVKEKQEYKILVMMAPNSQKEVSQKEIVQEMEEATNVKINWEEVAQAIYAEKLNITLASGQLPDAIMGAIGNDTILNNIAAFLPLQNIVKEWAPNLTEALDSIEDMSDIITFPDGNMYSLPYYTNYGTVPIASIMYINRMWLDKLGLKVPETTEDFRTVLQAFKTQDPNGNGKADEIPLGFEEKSINGITKMDALFGSFGILENKIHLNIRDGRVFFASQQPEYLEALQYLNSLYQDGLMDKEGFTQSEEQYTAKGVSGVYGVFFRDYKDIMTGEYINDYIAMKPLKGPKGDMLWSINNETVIPGLQMNAFEITKQCKNPEVLIRWIDYMNSSLEMKHRINYGKEGECWQTYDNGNWGMKTDNLPEGMNYAQLRQTTSFWVIAPIMYTAAQMDKYQRDARMQLNKEYTDIYAPYLPKEYINLQFIMTVEENTEKTNLFTDIDNHVVGFMANSIMSGVTQAQWEANLEQLKRLKVDEYIKLYQGYYDRQKTK